MNTLKAFQIFPPNKHGFCHKRELPSRKICFLSHSNNLNETPAESSPEGDAQKQELLAKIAMLQAQKVRLTDYLDERSAYLTQFAEEANAEFDEIRETALKGLDESGTRIMENLESRMQAFEESQESNRSEIEKNEKKLLDFEAQMENDRNEGLFFKNLLLMGLIGVSIADVLISSPDWRKVAVLGAIFVALFSQFAYEQSVSSETAMRRDKMWRINVWSRMKRLLFPDLSRGHMPSIPWCLILSASSQHMAPKFTPQTIAQLLKKPTQ